MSVLLGWERTIVTLSVRRPQPYTILGHRKKEEEGKIVEDKNGSEQPRSREPREGASSRGFKLPLKPVNPTPSYTESPRSFHRNSERE